MLLSLSLLAACHNDDNNSNKPEFPTKFSNLSVEENKQNLEDNGITLVNDLTTLKNSTGIQTSVAFNAHLDGSTGLDNLGARATTNVRLIQILSSFGKGKTSASNALKELGTAGDFTSFQDEYNNDLGIYTFNKADESWSYEKTGDKIVFKFPSTEAGTVNNAEYAIYGYKGVTITSNLGGSDYTGDYPSALKADLTVDGTKKMGYVFSAAYNSSGDPSAVTIALSIDNFTFTYAVSNSTKEAKVEYSLTEDSKILFAFGLSSTGSFSSDNIENSSGAGDVVTSGSAYFQILNIKFSGKVNADALAKALENATTEEEQAQAWNDNYKLLVYYADSKQKIADSEFYATERTDTYNECGENPDTHQYECHDVEEQVPTIDIRLVFADGTKSDLETYTDVGFQDLSDKLDALFND